MMIGVMATRPIKEGCERSCLFDGELHERVVQLCFPGIFRSNQTMYRAVLYSVSLAVASDHIMIRCCHDGGSSCRMQKCGALLRALSWWGVGE